MGDKDLIVFMIVLEHFALLIKMAIAYMVVDVPDYIQKNLSRE